MKLQFLAFGSTLMLSMGCAESANPSQPISLNELVAVYQHTVYGHDDDGDRIDTLAIAPKHDGTYVQLDSTSFTLLGKKHMVRGYSNEFESATDSYLYMLELDSFGMIYAQSLSWPGGFSVIHTSDDSLNLLISAAIGAAFRPGERGAHYSYERAEQARPRTPEQ